MPDFEFEVVSSAAINLRYNYGGEWFTFNLFLRDGYWILHPFQGILIGNKEMCRLVVAELFSHKPFQVMLAKENIPFSTVRSSVDLEGSGEDEVEVRRGSYDFGEDEDAGDSNSDAEDMISFAQRHSIEEVIQYEQHLIRDRIDVYTKILERMFMDGLDPHHSEFQKVQAFIRIYEEAHLKFSELQGLNDGGSSGRRRW